MKTSIKDQLIGSWSLVSLTSEAADGTVTYLMGEHPAGLIIYTVAGYMAVQIMRPGRTAIIDPALYAAKPVRYDEIGYLAYCGHFRTDELQQLVFHDVEVSLYSEWLGLPQVRTVTFDGELLHLTTAPLGAQRVVTRLVWKRN